MIEQAYTQGERMGLAVWGTDESGPYQAIPQPGVRWRINLFRHYTANRGFLAFSPTLTGSFHTPERFGWIVAPSSTTIQPSEVHTGLTSDPRATLDHLFETLVAARSHSEGEPGVSST